jgi:hypothetical protein
MGRIWPPCKSCINGRTSKGFTTNPTLMRKAGITNYAAFARDVLRAIPDRPISFEVFSDEFTEMKRQAREIASWGSNVYVKIPVSNTRRQEQRSGRGGGWRFSNAGKRSNSGRSQRDGKRI